MVFDHQEDHDAELIVRAYQGDKDAFGDLYERYLQAGLPVCVLPGR